MSSKKFPFASWQDVATLLSSIAALVAVAVAWRQLGAVNDQLKLQGQALVRQEESLSLQGQALTAEAQVASASYMLALSEQLQGPRFRKIRLAIQDHSASFDLSRGGIKDNDVDEYISRFETVSALVLSYDVVKEKMAYDEFSYDMEKAYCNEYVKSFIDATRKDDGSPAGPEQFYINFTTLAQKFLTRDKKHCKDLDGQ